MPLRLRLVVTADDLGYSAERTAGILSVCRRTKTESEHAVLTQSDASPQRQRNDSSGSAETTELPLQRGSRLSVVREPVALVTGACLMSGLPHSEAAAALAAAQGVALGLHLNLTEGLAVHAPHDSRRSTLLIEEACLECDSVGGTASSSSSSSNSSSSRSGGRHVFRGKFGFFEALSCGELDMADVAAEIRAQFAWFHRVTGGQRMQFVAGHNHCHAHPEIARVLASILVEDSAKTGQKADHDRARKVLDRRSLIAGIRAPALLAHSEAATLSDWPDPGRTFLQSIRQMWPLAASEYACAGVPMNDGFVGLALTGRHATVERVTAALRELAELALWSQSAEQLRKRHVGAIDLVHVGIREPLSPLRLLESHHGSDSVFIVEYMAHPGFVQIDGSGDAFSRSPEREHERNLMCSPELALQIETLGFELVSWQDAFK